MFAGRWIAGIGLGALVAAGIAVAPSLNAQQGRSPARAAATAQDIGGFTPAAADPRLAAVLARSGLGASEFRFTPSESTRRATRNVTVAVRGQSARGARTDRSEAAPASVSLTPIAYNLGVSVGWRRFAVSGDVARIDMAGAPGSREVVDVGVSYTGKRAAARVRATADTPLADAPRMIETDPNYSIDVGGAYSVTRNLDVTAGVRYRTERERDRLPMVDQRRDSQAVYIGTAFRF